MMSGRGQLLLEWSLGRLRGVTCCVWEGSSWATERGHLDVA